MIKEITEGAVEVADRLGGAKKSSKIMMFSMVTMFLLVAAWGNIEQRILSAEIARSNKNVEWLVANAGDVKVIKASILQRINDTSEYWKQEFLPMLGQVLAENNIQFPQKLNLVVQRYVTKYDTIKDELIFP